MGSTRDKERQYGECWYGPLGKEIAFRERAVGRARVKSANVFGMNAKEQDETHCCNVQGFCKIL